MNIVLSVPLICAIVGVVFGIINNELRASTFWFWLSLLTAVLIGAAHF